MSRSDRFGPHRLAFTVALLVLGFMLLAFALLMDARLTPSPYPNQEPAVTDGN